MEGSASLTTPRNLQRLLFYMEQDPKNPTLRMDAVRAAWDTGERELARSLLEAGLIEQPAEPRYLAMAGFLHLQLNEYEEAEHVLQLAMANGADWPELHFNLSLSLAMQRRWEQALERLVPHVASNVPGGTALRVLALHQLGRIDKAIEECRAHLETVVDDPQMTGHLALLLVEQGRHGEAKVYVERALEQDPGQLEALLAKASVRFDAAEYDVARDSFEAIAQAHPTSGRALLGQALAELAMMKVDDALRSVEQAVHVMPWHVGTWHVLAWVHLMKGDTRSAERAFGLALSIDRAFAESHGGLAVVAALDGRETEARAAIRRALRLNPQAMSPQYAEMLLAWTDGRQDDANAIFDAFMERKVSGTDLQFRTMVSAHADYLRLLAMRPPEGGLLQ